ncbi:hypothetical protein ABPG73_013114 [Tetrahymena malaccensis]
MSRVPSSSENVTNSVYQHCLGDGYLEPYDPRCRPWYTYAQKNEGYFFYEPYKDIVQQSLVMTLASQVKYNSKFQSVQNIAFDMKDLIQSFVSSQNQYSVLFHEFNNTIFYHPELNEDRILSWQDLEFKNITKNCLTSSELEACNQEKQVFSSQLNQTIQFIKSGNYSINQQINLDQLYQYWSKFGVKQISLVFPLVSKISKYKTQQPYSYSIILTSIVIEDQSDRFYLLNIININWIKVPLIIVFILVSLTIIIFLINYGKFQIYQVQNPIEILIKFLKKNLILQRQTQVSKITKKLEKQTFFAQNTNKNKKQIQIINPKLKYEETANNLFSPTSLDSLKQMSKNIFITNQNPLNYSEKATRDNQQNQIYSEKVDFSSKLDSFRDKRRTRLTCQQTSKTILSTPKLNQQVDLNFENQEYFNLKDTIKTTKNTDKSSHSLKKESQIYSEQNQEKEQQSKILEGLEPLFLEMKIIKETFQNLESLINYQIDAQTQNPQDIMNGLFHFAKAKCTFQKLQNQNGLIRCYFNLGLIYLIKHNYQLASEYFLSSIQFNCMLLGIDYQQVELQQLTFAYDIEQEDQLFMLKKRILCFAYSLKQVALQQIDNQIKSNLSNNFYDKLKNYKYVNEQILKNNLKKSLDSHRIIENLIKLRKQNVSKLFEIFINLEILEILIHLDHINQLKEIKFYIDETKIIINKIQPNFLKQKLQFQNQNERKFDMYESVVLEEDLSFSFQNNQNNTSQEIKFMAFEIWKSKLTFLQGKLELFKENHQTAIEYLTQSLEEGQFYSPIQRQNIITYLCILFQKLSIRQDFIDELILTSSTPIELVLLIQLDFLACQNASLNQFFENIQKSKFFRKKDGIQIIIFSQKLQTVIPLAKVENCHHFKLIIETFQTRTNEMIQDSKENIQKLDWQQALTRCVNKMTQLNLLQINKLKKELGRSLNNSNHSNKNFQNVEMFKNTMKMLENKKQVIILFSKQPENKNKINAKHYFDKKIQFNFQKIIIYHMMDQFILDNDLSEVDSEFFQYQPVLFNKDLIQKLNQLRTDYLCSSKEFITLVNNAL